LENKERRKQLARIHEIIKEIGLEEKKSIVRVQENKKKKKESSKNQTFRG